MWSRRNLNPSQQLPLWRRKQQLVRLLVFPRLRYLRRLTAAAAVPAAEPEPPKFMPFLGAARRLVRCAVMYLAASLTRHCALFRMGRSWSPSLSLEGRPCRPPPQPLLEAHRPLCRRALAGRLCLEAPKLVAQLRPDLLLARRRPLQRQRAFRHSRAKEIGSLRQNEAEIHSSY